MYKNKNSVGNLVTLLKPKLDSLHAVVVVQKKNHRPTERKTGKTIMWILPLKVARSTNFFLYFNWFAASYMMFFHQLSADFEAHTMQHCQLCDVSISITCPLSVTKN